MSIDSHIKIKVSDHITPVSQHLLHGDMDSGKGTRRGAVGKFQLGRGTRRKSLLARREP